MDKFIIRGGNPLVGTVRVSGAKNSALPAMAAAILTDEEITLENIPQVRDIETQRRLLASMGAVVARHEGDAQDHVTISCRSLSDPVARYEIVKTMRASSLVLGPLIARAGMARVAMPGAAPSAAAPSICTSRVWKKWARSSCRSMGILRRASIRVSVGCAART